MARHLGGPLERTVEFGRGGASGVCLLVGALDLPGDLFFADRDRLKARGHGKEMAQCFFANRGIEARPHLVDVFVESCSDATDDLLGNHSVGTVVHIDVGLDPIAGAHHDSAAHQITINELRCGERRR